MRPLLNSKSSLLPAAAALAALALLALPGQALADREVDRTIEAAANAVIEIENTSGSIEVRGWDQNEVRVTGTIGDDVEELVVEGGSRSIVIEVDIPEGRRVYRSIRF